MKPGVMIAAVVAVLVVGVGVYMVDFDMSGEARLPDVDVAVAAGELPEVDVEVGSVDVGTREVLVEVPDVSVTAPGDRDAETVVSN